MDPNDQPQTETPAENGATEEAPVEETPAGDGGEGAPATA